MNIKEYRDLVTECLFEPLIKHGFKMKGDHLYRVDNDTTFALMRIKDKWSDLTQQVTYLVVVRHNFLPDLDNNEIEGFAEHPALYPFKVNPLKLSNLKKGLFTKSIKYQYESCNLGHYDTVDIDYGDTDTTDVLKKIEKEIESNYKEIVSFLQPSEGSATN